VRLALKSERALRRTVVLVALHAATVTLVTHSHSSRLIGWCLFRCTGFIDQRTTPMLLSALRRQAASVVGRHNRHQHVASRLPAAHLMPIITSTGGSGPMASCDGDTAALNQPLSPPASSGCIDGDAPAIGGGHRYPHRGKAAGSAAIDGHTLRTTQPATTTATAAAGGSVWSAPPGHQQTVGILRHIIGQRMAMVRLQSVQFSTVATGIRMQI